jgi:quinol-cytochrome oxidoreductase complex cytochrome b subunit/coenzyme F420-reducing hydrogenase delta subunit
MATFGMKRVFSYLFAKADAVFNWSFGQRGNPLVHLGSLGWYFFWIVAGSGIYLYIFFDTGVTDAYASVEYMTNIQWYAAGVMRSLHRYASDALVVVALLHMLREFALDRMRGKRFFAWITGIATLGFIYACGITGYWLVWDQLAQMIAISTAEWLDTLPFFGEPIANNFLNSTTLSGRFFTLMVFMHIFAPLFMLLLMWVHIQRHSQAKVNPPKPLAIGTTFMLLALSFLYPATSQGPADLDAVPVSVGLDWFFLAGYPLLDIVPGGILWLISLAVVVLLAMLPWVPPAKPEKPAVVSLDNCNGCARCFDDCPFSAISMAPRSDGLAFSVEAVVNADNCVSCGICVGSCPTATPFRRASEVIPGIELPDHSIAGLRERSLAAAEELEGDSRIIVYACERSGADALQDPNVRVLTMPCVGMLPPAFIDFALSRDLADGVMLAGCAEGACHYRLGDDWTQQRIDRERDPYLRKRVPRERLNISWLPKQSAQRQKALDEFSATLSKQPAMKKRRKAES